MRLILVAVVALSAVLSGACGGSTNTPAPPAPRVLHEADAGGRVTLLPGQGLEVDLTDTRAVPGSSLVWTASSSDGTVLAKLSDSRSPAQPGLARGDVYRAVFRAGRPGSATILAVGATTCEAMAKSNCPDRSWSVTVTVA